MPGSCACVCVDVCVAGDEQEREREREKGEKMREREKGREQERKEGRIETRGEGKKEREAYTPRLRRAAGLPGFREEDVTVHLRPLASDEPNAASQGLRHTAFYFLAHDAYVNAHIHTYIRTSARPFYV